MGPGVGEAVLAEVGRWEIVGMCDGREDGVGVGGDVGGDVGAEVGGAGQLVPIELPVVINQPVTWLESAWT